MATSFVDLQIGIPKEFSLKLSVNDYKEIIDSHVTQMLRQMFPESADAEIVVSVSMYLEVSSHTAIPVEGNTTVQ